MSTAEKIPVAPGNEYYEVRAIPGKGYGCFALKDIKRGVRILADAPLLVVPLTHYLQSDIQEAFDKLSPEDKDFYFSLHSGHGQDPRQWPAQIHPTVTGRERVRIDEQHAARVSKTASLISVFQTNCMECDDGAGIFPHAARINHSCNPNACFNWNPNIGKETVHIMTDVGKGEEITISYCDMTHEKTLRSWDLKHYGFICDCRACTENADDETTFAYESMERRYKIKELERGTRLLRGHRLKDGMNVPEFVPKLVELAALYRQEGDFTNRLSQIYLDIALICEIKLDYKMAAMLATTALQVQKDCQGEDHPEYDRYSEIIRRIQMKLR